MNGRAGTEGTLLCAFSLVPHLDKHHRTALLCILLMSGNCAQVGTEKLAAKSHLLRTDRHSFSILCKLAAFYFESLAH